MTMILLKIDEHARSFLWHVTALVVWNAEANFLSDVTMPSMNIYILINWTETEENDFYAAIGFLWPFQMKREASPHCIFLNRKQRHSLINSRWLVSFLYPGSRLTVRPVFYQLFFVPPLYLIAKISPWGLWQPSSENVKRELEHTRTPKLPSPPVKKQKNKKWQEKNERNSLLTVLCRAHSHYSPDNALDFQTVPHNVLP